MLNTHNSRFEVPNLEEDLIRTHFRKPFEGETGIFVTAADILEQISSCLRYPLSPNKIGRGCSSNRSGIEGKGAMSQ